MIFFFIGCSFIIALGFFAAFLWAHKAGQHNDTYTPAVRILFEDEPNVKQRRNEQKAGEVGEGQ